MDSLECRRYEDFEVWNAETNDFNYCFFNICLLLPTLSFLAISSAYYIGKRRFIYTCHTTWNTCQSVKIYSRSGFAAILCLLPVIDLMVQLDVFDNRLTYVQIATGSLKSFTWFLHIIYILRLKRGISYNTRGPKPIILCWILTAIVSLLHLRSEYLYGETVTVSNEDLSQLPKEANDMTNETLNSSRTFNESTWALWLSIVEATCQGLYFLSLIPEALEEVQYRYIFNGGGNAHESHSFLDHETNSFVGFQEEDEDPMYLGIAKENSGWISKLFFAWVNPLLRKGACGFLRYSDDLFDLPGKLSVSHVATSFQKANEGKTIIQALHSSFGFEFYCIGVIKFIGDAASFSGPIFLNLLVTYIEEGDEWKDIEIKGYYYVVGLFCVSLLSSLCNVHFNMRMAEVTLKMKAALNTGIYQKTVHLKKTTLEAFSAGEIMNFMSTDIDRITNFCPSFHAFWSLPLQIGVSLYMLFSLIGLSSLAGLGFSILLIPINKVIANKIGSISQTMMQFKDSRVDLMSEILYGIRILKFHSWEDFFIKKINKIRKKELSSLRSRKYLDAICVFFWATTQTFVSLFTFGTYVLLGNQLTASKVFTCIALFNMLIAPLNALPWVINGVVEAFVSVKRLSHLFEKEETDPEMSYELLTPSHKITHDIIIENSSFSWKANSNEETNFTIELSDLEFKKGDFIGIVGEVGSGKTSLLHALMGELEKRFGHVSVSNSILNQGCGVVLQDPWVQRGTIRTNILFGMPYNPTKYKTVIEGCCLDADLAEFEKGDETIVGDSGATLSGGQRIRLALARAVYQDKNLYLLDDIFSAVDYNVGKDLYKKCILGLLEGKTRVVVTHHVSFLRNANLIIVMDKGKIIKRGKPSEILPIFFEDEEISSLDDTQMEVNPSKASLYQSTEYHTEKDKGGNEENREIGAIRLHVYTSYFSSIGKFLCLSVLISLLAMQGTKNASDVWLAYWISQIDNNGSIPVPAFTTSTIPPPTFESYRKTEEGLDVLNEENANNLYFSYYKSLWPTKLIGESFQLMQNLDPKVEYFFSVFIFIGLLNAFFTLGRAFLFAYGGIKGAAETHTKLLSSVLKAKVSFFDLTPIGRIINRFASDIFIVDDSLPFILNILLAQFFLLLGTVVITCYSLPWILIIYIPLLLVANNVQEFYRKTARQLRRLSSIALSPLFAHFSETMKGLVIIRSMRAIRRFEDENEAYLEGSLKAVYSTQAVAQWLNLRLQFIGVFVITGVGLIGVIQHHFRIADPEFVGLGISYSLILTSSLSGFINFLTETEKEMVGVERVIEYTEKIEEESNAKTLVKIPYAWPTLGIVTFQNVSLKYRDELGYALRQVSFETRPFEKIGIVGRTGSGKSSLLQALFRMVDSFEGNILIDSVNTRNVNIKDLRKKLCIIPQQPLIFTGSLRENLDPKGNHSEEEIIRAIEKCQLGGFMTRVGGIGGSVGEGGNLLSAGQKQLLCLARAILINAKILCIDEATANCDQETDKIIQSTIRTSFRHNTVITIAHRVHTILYNDRVIVMNKGEIVEFDGPQELMLDKASHFYRLAHGVI